MLSHHTPTTEADERSASYAHPKQRMLHRSYETMHSRAPAPKAPLPSVSTEAGSQTVYGVICPLQGYLPQLPRHKAPITTASHEKTKLMFRKVKENDDALAEHERLNRQLRSEYTEDEIGWITCPDCALLASHSNMAKPEPIRFGYSAYGGQTWRLDRDENIIKTDVDDEDEIVERVAEVRGNQVLENAKRQVGAGNVPMNGHAEEGEGEGEGEE
ncbi:MAG: hypothetical protein MMC23_006019 [Stictis urceolatum]|nr:hypothetical protein [Stictis urceolata]